MVRHEQSDSPYTGLPPVQPRTAGELRACVSSRVGGRALSATDPTTPAASPGLPAALSSLPKKRDVEMPKSADGYAAGWCIHYRSPSPAPGERVTACSAGVSHDTFHGVRFDLHPCFLTKEGKSKTGALECEHIRRPTSEEITAHEESWDRHLAKTMKTIAAIAPWRKANKGRSHTEVIECPICQGRLHLSIAAVNGHVHAQCETEDCMSWME